MISVSCSITLDKASVWKLWNSPEHVINWNFAAPEWHCPHAESDFQAGGKFSYTMAARDQSFSFEYSGVYDEIQESDVLNFTLDDGRKVTVEFVEENGVTQINEKFEPENENPLEMQRAGWQAILDNFKKYAETFGANRATP